MMDTYREFIVSYVTNKAKMSICHIIMWCYIYIYIYIYIKHEYVCVKVLGQWICVFIILIDIT